MTSEWSSPDSSHLAERICKKTRYYGLEAERWRISYPGRAGMKRYQVSRMGGQVKNRERRLRGHRGQDRQCEIGGQEGKQTRENRETGPAIMNKRSDNKKGV